MGPSFADAGGPFLVVLAGGVIVAAVAAVVGIVLLGLYIARRLRKPPAPREPDEWA